MFQEGITRTFAVPVRTSGTDGDQCGISRWSIQSVRIQLDQLQD